ncbi:alpha-glucan family phosphorylase [Horticoccus sp. 23ND18S-11]|uniref:alpha-glucan family phosphorylase n=1 Tax=Horticoccus sp. 23ND18S-11 TaxID=3391832 RepID=UPI0039C97843
MPANRTVAYFSMEIALDPAMPTYAGGLGILAGDMLRSCADLAVPVLAVTLLHRHGYLTQRFDSSGWQHEVPAEWPVEKYLTEMPARVTVQIEHRTVALRAWRYQLTGLGGAQVPVFLLDTDLPENASWDRTLAHFLYGGDAYYRLCQEIVLGIGGVRMMRALGCENVQRFHLNEGHASLLTLELLHEEAKQHGRTRVTGEDIDAVKARCVFTTHTPVAAGHDQFAMDLVGQVFGPRVGVIDLRDVFCADLVRRVVQLERPEADLSNLFSRGNTLNLTHLALNLSHYVNGVAMRHAEVSRQMFGKYQVDAISNGVHAATWTSPAFQQVFDRHIPGWRADNYSLRYALSIPTPELWTAHLAAKEKLIAAVRAATRVELDPQLLTLGFARRSTPYKRPDLIFTDPPRLQAIAARVGVLQIISGGKAHPNDSGGKEIIQRILRLRDALGDRIRVVYLENYDMGIAQLMTAGVDVWLNTPLPPLEASGTSGMKAALNGVPSLSVLDGWWLEGCIEGVTGWSIGDHQISAAPAADRTARDAASLYDQLEHVVAPLYYRERARYLEVMRTCIALNGSFFNTQRMVQQYVLKAYAE